MLTRFLTRMEEETGQGLVEYALILFLVSVTLAATLTLLAGGIDRAYQAVIDLLPAAG